MPAVTSEPISVLVVDDHEVVLLGLQKLLSHDQGFCIVGTARTGEEALSMAAEFQPTVVLLDIRMPDRGGIETCAKILEVSPKTRVLFLTSHADTDTILAAIMAGAHGYVLKEIRNETLTNSIRKVAEGEFVLDPIVTKRAMDLLKKLVVPDQMSPFQSLTVKEKTVLALVAEGHTNKEIAAKLKLSEKTIKNYLASVYQKLNVTRRSQAVVLYVKQYSM